MKPGQPHARVKAVPSFGHRPLFALVFGLFLGLTLLKFGNPVILDHKIPVPDSPAELWQNFWPTHWAKWFLLPLAAWAVVLAAQEKIRWPSPFWLWLLPSAWFGWQLLAATQTVDASLSTATLWQFAGCIVCYFTGALVVNSRQLLPWLLAGLLAALVVCLVRAVDQRLFEFPQTRQMLVEGERAGWTNVPPALLLEMKANRTIITTNGVDVANPVILAKFDKARVFGTLVYPNALAGMILLLLPATFVLVFQSTKPMKPFIRVAVIGLVCFLGGAAFYWTGSKLGWLIASALAGMCLLRLRWPLRMKWLAVVAVLVIGLGIFAVRFQNYFKAGATSTTARLDYWRAAVQTTINHPAFGTGPGTFQHPYAELKAPESEMARLTHNDYLEQFSDSGIIGGVAYFLWIILALGWIGRRVWPTKDTLIFALFLGVTAWFLQGLGEFGLYLPAAAWIAFTFLGGLLALVANEFDKKAVSR